MKPYYEADGITIYHADCRDILPDLRAEAAIFDPPYGLGVAYGEGYEEGWSEAPERPGDVPVAPRLFELPPLDLKEVV